jgi:hypothetical protein
LLIIYASSKACAYNLKNNLINNTFSQVDNKILD